MRLKRYDYTDPGYYFITICTHQRRMLFGNIENEAIHMNELGEIAQEKWREISNHFENVNLDYFVVMPNHIHGIIQIIDSQSVETRHASSLQNMDIKPISGVKPKSLCAIIGSYKAAVSRQINRSSIPSDTPIWQRGFYDHIIRNESSLIKLRQYIENNPLQWQLDHENPINLSKR
ncbi:MAG: transposase [Anaerolineaceae bacterium]|nr:transposase [Anaerolineaceae bacterium]